ncbi:hypothetical protein AALP_AA6G128300 [Arabis alpina]|uniref:DUF4220 domain-containing protein n=1 Tax=Arabis alpina TaxID=50452 RepID=A0A087GNW3_ARAAL|nr:hypothetical protein AALP_AA6G128300 [Arabis alpina]
MVQVIPTHAKQVWDAWNIRGMVLLSLSIQTILIIFAPLRKRTPNRFLVMVLWLSYLLADWSANFAIGLIAKNQGKDAKPEDPPQDQKLMALWAPFLLLHLGGPDAITAYSLEDNSLWHRHFLGLGLQAIAGAYVVIQSLPNTLSVIITLLFIAGTSKYLERTIALYLASSDKFRGSILKLPESGSDETNRSDKEEDSKPRSETYVQDFARQQRPLTLEKPGRDLTHLDILQFGFWFFNNFKSLMVNNIFSSEQRDESRVFFSKLKDEEALRILEVELGFIYEGLYTKVSVLHSWVGGVIRTVALASLLSAFFIFHFRPKKSHEFHGADIVITYTLFLVGIALDFISIVMVLPSDWTFAVFSRLNEDDADSGSRIDHQLNWFLGLKKLQWKTQNCCKGRVVHEVLNTPFLIQRWAGSMKLFNFIAYSVKADIERIHDVKGRTRRRVLKAILYPFIYAINIFKTMCGSIAILNHALHQYIRDVINQWSRKILVAHYAIVIVDFWFMIPHFLAFIGNFITSSLGINDLMEEIIMIRSVHSEPLTKELWKFIFTELQDRVKRPDKERRKTKAGRKGWVSGNTELDMADPERLMRYLADVDYDRSLMLWHIATELCYRKDKSNKENCNGREFSKILSDYMMYLLIMQPKLMSEVAGIGKIRFRDTLAEAERFFKRRHIENSRNVKKASKEILSVKIEIHPRDVKGNQSKSLLFEARALAKELNKMDDRGEKKWRVVSQVWMELLFHAACNCDATARMEQLSKGGELLNFVWLAIAHLGLGDQLSSSASETNLDVR